MRETSVGAVDPREIAEKLAKMYDVWLDVQRLGKRGLYEDIALGLKSTKLVVACVSEEYANSENCNMELTHAVKNLRLPVVVCIVGASGKLGWYHTPVGMLVTHCPHVTMHSIPGMELIFPELLHHIDSKLQQQTTNSAEIVPTNIKQVVEELQCRIEELQRTFLLDIHSFDKQDAFPKVFSILEDKKKYTLYFLCEHPGGWHFVPDLQPFSLSNIDLFLSSVPSYLFPLLQILKLSSIPTIEPVIPPSERSIPKEVSIAKLKGFLEKMMGLENMSEEKVEECVKPLKRVQFPTGEVQWLCSFHAKMKKFSD